MCPVFYNGLPKYLSDEGARGGGVGVLRIIYSSSYPDALKASSLTPLFDLREAIISRLSEEIYIDYFMVDLLVRFLFTSCEESQTNE